MDRKFSGNTMVILVSFLLIVASIVKLINDGIKQDDASYDYSKDAKTDVEIIGWNHDLGLLPQDTTVTHEVFIVNNGKNMLKVYFVDPDCNCTGYILSPSSEAEPGDSLTLALTIEMNKKKKGRFMLNTVVGMNTDEHLHRIAVEGEVY